MKKFILSSSIVLGALLCIGGISVAANTGTYSTSGSSYVSSDNGFVFSKMPQQSLTILQTANTPIQLTATIKIVSGSATVSVINPNNHIAYINTFTSGTSTISQNFKASSKYGQWTATITTPLKYGSNTSASSGSATFQIRQIAK